MPFVPLTPEEQEQYKPPCADRDHNPPSHFVIRTTMKWRCPSCGKTQIIVPACGFYRSRDGGDTRWNVVLSDPDPNLKIDNGIGPFCSV